MYTRLLSTRVVTRNTFVLLLPRSAHALDSYLDYRRRSSETITPNSPLFRNDFNINSIATVRKNSKPITIHTLRCIIHSRLIKAGLIERAVTKDKQRRHEVPLSHGFRKFLMTQPVTAKVNPEIREMLLGHKIGLTGAYYRPTEQDMLQEYEKAINLLTINEENRLKRKVEMLTIEKSKVDLALSQIEEMKKKIGLA